MAFTPEERARVRRYLGYPVLSGGELIDRAVLPAGITTVSFVLEEALDRVLPEAEYMVREQMQRIACIEQLQQQSYQTQLVVAAGRVEFAGGAAISNLSAAYVLETAKLADLINAPKFPLSELHDRIGGTGEGCVDEPC